MTCVDGVLLRGWETDRVGSVVVADRFGQSNEGNVVLRLAFTPFGVDDNLLDGNQLNVPLEESVTPSVGADHSSKLAREDGVDQTGKSEEQK